MSKNPTIREALKDIWDSIRGLIGDKFLIWAIETLPDSPEKAPLTAAAITYYIDVSERLKAEREVIESRET